MRKPRFLSPSSKSRWLCDRAGFYLKYLAESKMDREPQAIYMGVGSAFDAQVKSEIMVRAMGKPLIAGSTYDFPALFEAQVEHHHRDRCMEISRVLWDTYVACGAFESLWKDIERSPCAPMMEERVEGVIGGVPLLGLPDLVYIDADSLLKVVDDWKILGSASKIGGGASPPQGYKIVRDGWVGKPSPQNGKAHKKHVDLNVDGMTIGKEYLEDFNLDWADQMSTYAWLLGSKVGAEDFIVRIECGSCRHPVGGMKVKWSTHLNRVSATHQLSLIKTYKAIWEAIENEHIFSDLTKQESQDRCEVMEMQADMPPNVHKPLQGVGRATTHFYMRTG